jgi:hypothetical protein
MKASLVWSLIDAYLCKPWQNNAPDHVSIRFEIFTAVTIKNGVFWDVKLLASVASYS